MSQQIDFNAEFSWLRHLLYTILTNQEREMAAIDDLNAAVTALTTDVQALIAKPAGTPDAAIAAATANVVAIDTAVKAALNPPA